MAIQTYKDFFENSLEKIIGGYGNVFDIIYLVNVYQENDIAVRLGSFQAWLKGQTFSCEFCDKTFTPEIDEIDEDNQVLCKKCMK